ncbi:hypothetical protein MKZ38_001189 [Zalerion maritima]|uniref:Uncharacterized protein n=1 Tax=Zalerion maritima TaxID=339359 RepID=A0AAD5RXL3_9PEZI|nr:hypothetical protein MKZ38_001189 [Zalerion maritima]
MVQPDHPPQACGRVQHLRVRPVEQFLSCGSSGASTIEERLVGHVAQYQPGSRDIDDYWLRWIQKEFNEEHQLASEGKYSLRLMLRWLVYNNFMF